MIIKKYYEEPKDLEYYKQLSALLEAENAKQVADIMRIVGEIRYLNDRELYVGEHGKIARRHSWWGKLVLKFMGVQNLLEKLPTPTFETYLENDL